MGVPLKRGRQSLNFLLFALDTSNLTKFGAPKRGSLNWVFQNLNFSTIQGRHMKLSE